MPFLVSQGACGCEEPFGERCATPLGSCVNGQTPEALALGLAWSQTAVPAGTLPRVLGNMRTQWAGGTCLESILGNLGLVTYLSLPRLPLV